MKVVLSDLARRRLHEIRDYIALDNARAAVRVVDRILWSAELLADHPKLGPRWRRGATRAFNVPGIPYRIHYRIAEAAGTVEIITIVHARKRPLG